MKNYKYFLFPGMLRSCKWLRVSALVFLSFIAITLFSCKNFLSGASLKEDLEKAIEYAKAPKTNVKIDVGSTVYGDVSPTSAVLIENESVDIEFIKKTECSFYKWVSYDSNGNELEDNVLEIKPFVLEDGKKKYLYKNESSVLYEITLNGLEKYSIEVTLNRVIPDIEIKPRCLLLNETVKPNLLIFNIAKTKEDAENGRELVYQYVKDNDTQADFSLYAKEDAAQEYIKDHLVSKKFWVYFEVEDSALKSAKVLEKLVRATSGNKVAGANEYSQAIRGENDADIFIDDERIPCEKVRYCFEYEFNEVADGVVDFTLCVEDICGNICTKSVNLIKDTVIELANYNSSSIDKPAKTMNYNITVDEIKMDTEFSEDGSLLIPYYFQFENAKNSYITDLNGKTYYDYDDWKFDRIETYTDDKPEKNTFTHTYTKTGEVLNVGSGTNPVVFKKEPYEDLYISVFLKDKAGNEYEHTMDLYKCLDIVHISYDSVNKTFELFLNKSIAEKATPKVWSAKRGGNKRTISSSYVPTIDKKQGRIVVSGLRLEDSNKTISSIGTGMYEIYIQGAGKAYLSNPYYVTKNANGTFSFSKTLNTVSVSLTQEDVPSFTVTADAPEINAAKRKVHVAFPEVFTEKAGLTYLVQYSHEANASYPATNLFTAQKDFEVPAHYCSWKFKIYVYDQNGNCVSTPDSSAKSLDLSDDNVPPEKDSDYEAVKFRPELILVQTHFSDNASGLDSGNGKAKAQYFFTNHEYNLDPDDKIKDEQIDWNQAGVKTTYYNLPDDDIVCYRFNSTLSYLYVRVLDNKLNYIVQKINMPSFESLEQPQVTFENDIITLTSVNGPVISLENKVLSFNSSKYEVIKVEYLKQNLDGTYFWALAGEDVSVTLNDEQINSFIRMYLYSNSNNAVSGYAYLYSDQYLSSLSSEFSDVIEGTRGINVLTDQPCLVQTYCLANPDEALKDKAEYWLDNALELEVQKKNKSFTYVLPESLVEYAGSYYTTIVQFADGTYIMTDVKRF